MSALLKSRLLYGAFALLAFAVALRLTFPSEAVKERLIYEAGARGWQIDVRKVGPGNLLGVRLQDVALTNPSGMKVPLERLDASLKILPLLLGKRVAAFRASFLDGTISGTADLSGDLRHLAVEVKDLDLGRALPLRQAAGRTLEGKVSGSADLSLPGGALEKASGQIALQVKGGTIGAGGVPIPGMTGNLPLPAISLGTLESSAKLEGGRATVEKLEVSGGDTIVSGEGLVVVLEPRLGQAPVSGRVRLRFAPSLWQKPDATSLRPLAEAALGGARTPDGAYLFQLSGSLGHPQMRPSGSPGAPPPPPPQVQSPPPAPAPPPLRPQIEAE